MAEDTDKHARLSPSAGGRWFECPGSIKMEEQVPGRRPSVNFYADEGTAAHNLLEHCLINDKDPHVFEEEFITVNGNQYPVDLEMKNAVSLAFDYIQGYRIVHDVEKFYTERRVNPGKWLMRDDLFGTADVTLPATDELCIADYKHGKGVAVEAKDNKQLLIYALGAALPELKWKRYRLVILQPRARHEEGPIREWVITRKELKQFAADLEEAADQVDQADAAWDTTDFRNYINPGEKQCNFCDAKPFCKELAEYNLEVARGEFADFDDIDLEVAPKTQKSALLSIDQLAYILNNANLINKWVKSVEEYAFQLLERGQKVPGRKLVKKKSNRIFGPEEDVVVSVLRGAGLRLGEIYTRKLITPATAETKVKALKDREALARLREIIEKPDGGLTIAAESDPRKAVEPPSTVEDDFAEDYDDIFG